MKRLSCLAVLLLVAGFAGPAQAQLSPPFGAPPPEIGKMAQCTKDYVKSVEQQLSVMEQFRSNGPEFVGQICTLIEGGSALLGKDGELPDSLRQQLKTTLGVDIDLRYIKTQCRVGQGNLDRELMSQIGLLKSELLRCNDTI